MTVTRGGGTRATPPNRAFDNLWKVQTQAGDDKGAWDWLDFGLEPWESKGARYYEGRAGLPSPLVPPAGYYKATADTVLDGKVELLRGYLKGKFADQNLHNRAWALWAGTKLDGVLTPEERKQVISQLLAKQRDDGGWSLPSLGAFVPRRWDAARYVFRCVRHRVHSSYPADGWRWQRTTQR